MGADPAQTGLPTVVGSGCGGSVPTFNYTNQLPVTFSNRDMMESSPTNATQPVINGTVLGENLNISAVPYVPAPCSNCTVPMFPSFVGGSRKRSITYPVNRQAAAYLPPTNLNVGGVSANYPDGSDIPIQPYYRLDTTRTHLLTTLIVYQPYNWTGEAGLNYEHFYPDDDTFLFYPVETIFSGSPPCNVKSHMYEVKYDFEADRVVFVSIASTLQDVCIAIAGGSTPGPPFNTFSFNFAGQTISHFQFSVWGDYYTSCWLDAVTNSSKCYVFERQRILFGGGPPRVMLAITPSDWSTYPFVELHPVTLANNSTRGDFLTTWSPCGMFIGVYSVPGHIQYVRCVSVDYNLLLMTASEVTITVAPWDASVGSCIAYDSCIPCNFYYPPIVTFHNPLRNTVRCAYRVFGATQKLACVFQFEANGVTNSKLKTVEYELSSGIPVSTPAPIVFDPEPGNFGTGTHLYGADIVYDHNAILYLAFAAQRQIYGFEDFGWTAYKFTFDPGFRPLPMTSTSLTGSEVTMHKQNWFRAIAVVQNYPLSIWRAWYGNSADSQPPTYRKHIRYMDALKIQQESFNRTFTGTDACNVQHTCKQLIILNSGTNE